ncbi:MAG: hypothetical protein OXC62_08380 [Aestuariivita sp.]|nr:hypothetical protein [Aestuariivita sp.]
MSADRVSYCDERMDAAYGGTERHQVAIIDPNPRRHVAFGEHLCFEALA